MAVLEEANFLEAQLEVVLAMDSLVDQDSANSVEGLVDLEVSDLEDLAPVNLEDDRTDQVAKDLGPVNLEDDRTDQEAKDSANSEEIKDLEREHRVVKGLANSSAEISSQDSTNLAVDLLGLCQDSLIFGYDPFC